MNTRIRMLGIAALAGILVLAWWAMPTGAAVETKEVQTGEFRISGPYTHDNLTVFLIHGPDRLAGRRYLTLPEALEQKKAVMHETSNVNELAIENLSRQADILVQSGDIVKGGRQDRISALDLVVPAARRGQPARIPVAAFCVEAGRWHQRGQEADARFEMSPAPVPSKQLKAAARARLVAGIPAASSDPAAGPGLTLDSAQTMGQVAAQGRATRRASGGASAQGTVWSEVATLQGNLGRKLGQRVRSAASPSSLELTLENPKVRQAVEPYVRQLDSAMKGQTDVVGYAFAISGKLNSIEVYGSPTLFRTLWPRLLRASAVEAIAESVGHQAPVITAEQVKACLLSAEKGRLSSQVVPPRTQIQVREAEGVTLFETRDQEQADTWIHRSYLTK